GAWLELVLGHSRTGVHAHDLARDAERLERALDDLHVALDLVSHPLPARGYRVEERDRRKLPVDLRDIVFGLRDNVDGRLLCRFLALAVARGNRSLDRLFLRLFDMPERSLLNRWV